MATFPDKRRKYYDQHLTDEEHAILAEDPYWHYLFPCEAFVSPCFPPEYRTRQCNDSCMCRFTSQVNYFRYYKPRDITPSNP